MDIKHDSDEALVKAKKELARLRKQFKKHSVAESVFLRILLICNTILFPLYEAIYLGILKDHSYCFGINSQISFGWIDGITIIILIAHVSFAISYFFLSGRADLRKFTELSSCVEHIEEITTRKNDIKNVYSTLYKSISVFRYISKKIQESHILIQKGSIGSFEEELNYILLKFCSGIPVWFGFDSHIKYNFSIYMIDVDTMSLMCAFRKRDPSSDELLDRPSRTWKPGQGHIGKCFSNVVSYIDNDITQDPMFPYVNNDPEDKKFYRSAISIPLEGIVDCKDKIHCERQEYGVMLMTCSEPGWFTELHLELMITLKMLTEEFIYKLWEVTNDEQKELS